MTRVFVFRSWPKDQTERLKELWWMGKSAAECCKILGAVSPKACKEKADREGFKRDPELETERLAHKISEFNIPQLRADGVLVTIENAVAGECRFMFDDPAAEAPMCGRTVEKKGTSWCPHHRARVFVRTSGAGIT